MNQSKPSLLILLLLYTFLTALFIRFFLSHKKYQLSPEQKRAIENLVDRDIEKRKKEIAEVYVDSPEDLVTIANGFLESEITNENELMDSILTYTFLYHEGYRISNDTHKWVKIEQRKNSEG